MKYTKDPGLVDYVRNELVPEGTEYKELQENRIAVRINVQDADKLAERFLNKFKARLIHETAVDLEGEGFDMIYIYDFTNLKDRLVVMLEAFVSKDDPSPPSLANITWSASWAEREIHDLLGITPVGTPDPRSQSPPQP